MSFLLPPLNALRAFEAAARHDSITRAAIELRVSHSAVTRQIKLLERFLGRALFAKAGRGVALTPDGERYQRACRRALAEVSEATRSFVEQEDKEASVTVSVAPAFAIRWLLPRLPGFQAAHPRVDVRISATERLADLAIPEAQIAIRHGSGQWTDLVCRPLVADRLIAVGRPELFGRSQTCPEPEILTRYQHYFDTRDAPWEAWYTAAGRLDLAGAAKLNPCAEANLVIEFAMSGRGIGLARASLVEAELASGTLIAPFSTAVSSRFSAFLVWHPAHKPRGATRHFVDWLLEQRIRP